MTLDEAVARHGDLVRPTLALRPDPSGSGRSCVGGDRMLARAGQGWPQYAGEPMLLLAQVDFAECAGLVAGLPRVGALQAFISMRELPTMGESDLEAGAARLRILGTEEPLAWIESGRAAAGYAVGFETLQTVPEGGLEALSDEENDVLLERFRPEGHRMLGHPTSVQYDPFDYPERYDPRGNRVLALQVDGDEALGWRWVHQGVLHFLADGVALAAGRIEDAQFDMQFL